MKIEVKIILQRLCLYLRPDLHAPQPIQISLRILLRKDLTQHLPIIEIRKDIMKNLRVIDDKLRSFGWSSIQVDIGQRLVDLRCEDAVELLEDALLVLQYLSAYSLLLVDLDSLGDAVHYVDDEAETE